MPEPANAVGGREAEFALHVVGAPVPELLHTAVPAVIGHLLSAMTPWASGATQVNFFGGANRSSDKAALWPSEVAARLREVRLKHDPANRFPFTFHGITDGED